MSVRQKPHFTLSASTLAKWIERQPDKWWAVDGDPLLTSVVQFPCPGDELAPAIRKVGKDLLLYDKNPRSVANGEAIAGDKLEELSDVDNRHHYMTFLLNWIDSDIDWLLVEDAPWVAN